MFNWFDAIPELFGSRRCLEQQFPPGPRCAGAYDALSFLIDYRPLKRIDLYAGVSLSNVYGGLASGYLAAQNIDPTVGVRVKF